jgi:hypothetical protein
MREAALGLPSGAVLVTRRPITLAFNGVPFLGGVRTSATGRCDQNQ